MITMKVTESKTDDQSAPSGLSSFARALTSDVENDRREALKLLRQFLRARSASRNDFTTIEFKQLWKCLYHCMWICDKMYKQQKLAESMGKLVNCFVDPKQAIGFVDAYVFTIMREWSGLDHHRQEKYLYLTRHVFSGIAKIVHDSKFELDIVNDFNNQIGYKILDVKMALPSALHFHFCDIYFEEFATLGASEITHDVFVLIGKPFTRYLRLGRDAKLLEHIHDHVFLVFLDREKRREWKDLAKKLYDITFDCAKLSENFQELGATEKTKEGNRKWLYSLSKSFENATLHPVVYTEPKKNTKNAALVTEDADDHIDAETSEIANQRQLRKRKGKVVKVTSVEEIPNNVSVNSNVVHATEASVETNPTSIKKRKTPIPPASQEATASVPDASSPKKHKVLRNTKNASGDSKPERCNSAVEEQEFISFKNISTKKRVEISQGSDQKGSMPLPPDFDISKASAFQVKQYFGTPNTDAPPKKQRITAEKKEVVVSRASTDSTPSNNTTKQRKKQELFSEPVASDFSVKELTFKEPESICMTNTGDYVAITPKHKKKPVASEPTFSAETIEQMDSFTKTIVQRKLGEKKMKKAAPPKVDESKDTNEEKPSKRRVSFATGSSLRMKAEDFF